MLHTHELFHTVHVIKMFIGDFHDLQKYHSNQIKNNNIALVLEIINHNTYSTIEAQSSLSTCRRGKQFFFTFCRFLYLSF